MKKSILLFAFLTFSLFSCSSSDDNNSSIDTTQLVGTWLLESAKLDGEDVDSSYKVQFTSAERAKFYYRNPTSNTTFGPDIIENGDYSLNGNSFTITWDDSDPGNETDTFQILELTSTKLKVKSTDSEGTLIEIYTK
jgi:Lipocalin-like domain